MNTSHATIEIPTINPAGDPQWTPDNPTRLYLYSEDGLRICLGAPRMNEDAPDVAIERNGSTWQIFIRHANTDPDYIVVITPDHTRVEDKGGRILHATDH